MNPYAILSEFSTREAACAVCGVIDAKEQLAEVRLFEKEFLKRWPPTTVETTVDNWVTGKPSTRIAQKPASIPRQELLQWCDSKGLKPALLFGKKEELAPGVSRESLLRTIGGLSTLLMNKTGSKYRKASGLNVEALRVDLQAALENVGACSEGTGKSTAALIFRDSLIEEILKALNPID
jgi:hypothetical protein